MGQTNRVKVTSCKNSLLALKVCSSENVPNQDISHPKSNLKVPRSNLTNEKKQCNCSLRSEITASVGKSLSPWNNISQINICFTVSLSGPEMIKLIFPDNLGE